MSLWITEVAVLGAVVGQKEAPSGAELGAVGRGHGCVAWIMVTWVLLPLLHRGCLILENRDICRVQRSQRGSQAGGPCRRDA